MRIVTNPVFAIWFAVSTLLAGVLLLTSCQQSKDVGAKTFIAPYANIQPLCFYRASTGDDLLFTFFDGNSAVECVGVVTNIVRTSYGRRLEISCIQGWADSPGFQPLPLVDGGLKLLVVSVPNFEPKTWKVLYKDDNSSHEVKYGGLRKEPFKPWVIPATPSVPGDPFGTNFLDKH